MLFFLQLTWLPLITQKAEVELSSFRSCSHFGFSTRRFSLSITSVTCTGWAHTPSCNLLLGIPDLGNILLKEGKLGAD